MSRAQLEDVRLSYDGGLTWALDGVSLRIEPGERICVLGSNGSGKSSLAQVLAGLVAPDEGTVELAGRTCFDGSPDPNAYRHARRVTGLVFQNPEDQIVTSVVADDVAFGPENLGIERTDIARRVDEELGRVAMSAYAQADPARLSGGQQQRVAIASALTMHPDMLVLDEPGAMLDVRGRRGVMYVLDLLQEASTTLVHVTHFMDEALAADRVIVMRGGRVVLEGTPAEVFAHARELRECGLDLPLATRVSLELGLEPCASASELAHTLAEKGASQGAVTPTRGGCRIPNSLTFDAPEVAAASPSENTPAALRFSNVSFSYGAAPTLDGLSFELARGELVALIGQTGSGKSTIARLACALANPQSGEVSVCGIPAADRKRRRELRGKIGFVMQRPERQLFAETVAEDIAYGPRNLGLSEEEVSRRVNEQLEFLGIVDKASASPFDLSGGQQRLVALGGVLAMEPEVLVLDEPIAGLDPRGAAHLREHVRALHARGVAVLMISHSMEDVAELADRVIVLDHGRIALAGTPREVFSHGEALHKLGLGTPAPLELAHGLEGAGVFAPGELGQPLTASALVTNITRLRGGDRPC
ncbi:MAG: energy-coupling factor transporter ATPase [Parolsenella sp.]|uniref:ABC transporter ATP-binding protein n=1 Tax=Parolsenella sp. TaxID=2083006 RepID=UPI002A76560E|nr:energy-coupling factor transporter ATPase [Parolsenella sp.]MCI5949814.1 energy-coupling factor transporter ATPase [Coriobacteriaceae bacterium]MDY3292180.1 energy-coupling factor transporter ATPase [Parolsenella sp.]